MVIPVIVIGSLSSGGFLRCPFIVPSTITHCEDITKRSVSNELFFLRQQAGDLSVL